MAIHLSWCIPLDKKQYIEKQPKAVKRKSIPVGEITLFGMLGGLTCAAQIAMSPLPNIEPVSLLVMLYAVVFGWKCLYPIYVFVVLEILFFGIQLWNINYIYVWTILAFAAQMFRNKKNPLGWAILSGTFGLLFGFFCSFIYLFIGGPGMRFSWWASGILYDLMHCAGNFVLALVLFMPLKGILEQLYRKMKL